MQTIAISATTQKNLYIHIYIPQWQPHNLELSIFIQQLKFFIFTGDFNSYNIHWGSNRTDKTGKSIEDIIERENLYLFNNKSLTHLHLATGTYSTIDILLSESAHVYRCLWKWPHSNHNREQQTDTPHWNLKN